jgi:AraC-like DNA-binding protein/ligand-binding sensor protein
MMKEKKSPEAGASAHSKDDPVFDKAGKIVSAYMQATGSWTCVYDQNCLPVPQSPDEKSIEQSLCQFCEDSAACREMHSNAIREASRRGGSHVYHCRLGLVFWVSPIYSDGRFSGALRGTGYLRQEADAGVFPAMCKGEIPAEEFAARAAAFPKTDSEKTVSLAQMLLLCAESLSTGSEDYHEILRRRSEQQQILSSLTEELGKKYPEGSIMPGYPLDKERMLIAALRRGDSKEALNLLYSLLAVLIFANPNHFKYIQLRALELGVLLSRAGAASGNNGGTVMEANACGLKRIQEAKNIEELTDILHTMVKSIAEQIASFQGIPHAVALRKAERFIRENFSRRISLQEIAAVSGLSAPYFSTIFKEEMGENLSKYLNRLRVEKASKLLLETNLSLSEIAGACCFEDQSWFSKIFKTYTGLSPGKYRSQGGGMIREISENNLSEDYLKTIK